MSEKVVIVGGTRGIGEATAIKLSLEGKEVVISGRSDESIENGLESINKAVEEKGEGKGKEGKGKKVKGFKLELHSESSIKEFFDQVGKFDHLILVGKGMVHQAMKPFGGLKFEDFQECFDSIAFGYVKCIHFALPNLRKDGSIVMLASGVSRHPYLGGSAIGMAHAALDSLTKNLALDLAPLRVNTVTPGLIDTPSFDFPRYLFSSSFSSFHFFI